MAFLDQVVQVTIQAATATPSLPGFGIPAIIGYHTHWNDRLRYYSDLQSMVADGFSTTEPLYLMAQSILQQTPRPSKFAAIRGSTAVQQTMTLTVTDNVQGDKVGCIFQRPDGTTATAYVTVGSGQTTAQVATALATLIGGIPGLSAVAATSTVTVTVTNPGDLWYALSVLGATFADTTVTANPGADLDAALAVDNGWYGISGVWLSSANITAIAAWAETNKRLHGYTTADGANLSPASGVMNTLKGSNYKYTFGIYSASPNTYSAAGWLSSQLVAVPGSNNWAYKQIAGTTADNLSVTQQGNVTGNNGNFYVSLAGVPVTFDGRTASGQFIDLTVGIDSLTQKIQLRVATLLTTLPKLEYTRAGLSLVRGAVMAALQDSVSDGFLSNDSGFQPVVSIPDLSSIAPADKASRVLRSVTFVAYARGAINKIQINGTVNI